MTAIDTWIADIAGNKRSASSQPIIGQVANCIAAWQQVLSAIIGGGVTSVGLALPTNEFAVTGTPVTNTGTLTGAWKAQGANAVLAGPTPSFRPLAAADIPSLSATYLPLAGGTMAGAIACPNGGAGSPAIAFNSNYGLFYDSTNTALAISTAGAESQLFSIGSQTSQHAGGNMTCAVQADATTVFQVTRFSTDANGAQISARKARGSIAAPTVVATNDIIVQTVYSGYDGANFQTAASLRATVIETTPSATAMGGQVAFFVTPIGSVTSAEVARFNNASGLSMFGANVVIDANRLLRNRLFTVGTLPTFVEGASAGVSDATLTMTTGLGLAPTGGGANHVPVYADNVGWKIV